MTPKRISRRRAAAHTSTTAIPCSCKTTQLEYLWDRLLLLPISLRKKRKKKRSGFPTMTHSRSSSTTGLIFLKFVCLCSGLGFDVSREAHSLTLPLPNNYDCICRVPWGREVPPCLPKHLRSRDQKTKMWRFERRKQTLGVSWFQAMK